MEYRECRTCAEYLPIDDFYYSISEKTGKIHLSTPDCKECAKEKERQERRDAKDAAGIGSEKIFNLPNKYKDQWQKKQTFDVMLAMGWKFNEEKGIWYDDIKKTRDGVFIGVWTPTPKKIRPKLIFSENNPPMIKFKNERKGDLLPEETVNKILFDYYVKNMKLKDVAYKYNTNVSTVSTYTKYLYNQEMGRRRKAEIIPSNKTTLTRKKHFKGEKPTTIPTVILSRDKPMFTPEVVKQIQSDYFMGDLKFYEVVEKYADYEAKTVAYIIRRTMNLIKLRKDANEN